MAKPDPKAVQQLNTNAKTESGDGPKAQTGAQEVPNKLNELNLNDLVIETKSMAFSYAPKKGNLLSDINMTFPRSAIYGLLGPSGCGKTTMIKLIIGSLRPIAGKVKVNDKAVSDPSNKIPGPGIGYMPQDYALYNEFTIKETMTYFARIYGLSSEYTKKRIDFLVKFLDLPDPNLQCSILSGGQKRRTSLSIALIHNPPLLILDEPTVGVDPMLRERIWQHLVQLASAEKTSILITTHYIEECRRAHVIALMRGGHLLVENSPTELLNHFKTNDLEKVFLQVCKFEEQADRPNLPPLLHDVRKKETKGVPNEKKVWTNSSTNSSFCNRFCALITKNAIRLWRQKMFCLVSILLPIIGVILVCLTIGKKPFGLQMAVFNQELESGLPNDKMASVQLLDKLDKKTIVQMSYKDRSSAIDSVRNGDTFGALIIDSNFTEALSVRFASMGLNISDEVIDASTVKFYGDLTDLMIYQTIFRTLMEAEMQFKLAMMTIPQQATGDQNQTDSNSSAPNAMNPNSMAPIVDIVDPPVYGSKDPKFINFAVPGLLLVLVYLLSSAVTTLDIVSDRREGTLDRTLAAGVKMIEILTAQIFVRMFILIIQTIGVMLIVFVVFEIENKGNIIIVFALLMVHSVHGMAFGLLTSSLATDETMALMLCVGSFLPFLVISGIIWPLEGMHFILRFISIITPQTLPVLSLRAIILKGWSLGYTLVWGGFVISFIYLLFFLVLASCLNNSRRD